MKFQAFAIPDAKSNMPKSQFASFEQLFQDLGTQFFPGDSMKDLAASSPASIRSKQRMLRPVPRPGIKKQAQRVASHSFFLGQSI
jgi:hypothetical protein